MNYHVVVVGAGPGGAILARELAGKGIRVTLFEKGAYNELGHDWSDAVEICAIKAAGITVPELEGTRWKGDWVKDYAVGKSGVFEPHAVSRLQLLSPDYRSTKEIDFYMLTTDRRVLGRELIDQAVAAGAEVQYHRAGTGLLYQETGRKDADGVNVVGVRISDTKTGKEEDIKADIVVESSGFQCVLRSSLPGYTGLSDKFKNSDFALVHREIRVYDPELAATDVFPDHYRYGFHTGYQWSHVHDTGRIDVGAGVRNDPDNPDPRDLIEEFISRHPSIKSSRLGGGRSLCIVGRPIPNFVTNGFVILGDAASTSVPTTGCGAGSAILIGLWAAEVIAEAAADSRKDIAKLWEINRKFYLENRRGSHFAALSALRSVLQDLSHENLSFLFRQDIMDARTLQSAINGIFETPCLGTKIKSLLKGAGRPAVLSKLNLATGGGAQILQHYHNYPEAWNAQVYQRWLEETEALFQKVGS